MFVQTQFFSALRGRCEGAFILFDVHFKLILEQEP